MAHDSQTDPSKFHDENDSQAFVSENKSFEAFDLWMDAQLDLLVARWIHTAAPNASRINRMTAPLSQHAG